MAKSNARSTAGPPRKPTRVPLSVAREAVPAASQLGLARIVRVLGDTCELETASGTTFAATVDPTVHHAVLAGACQRHERVLYEVEGGRATVVGALRTRPTPGIDRSEEYHLEADRIVIDGEEISLHTRAARFAVRATGEIESYAERILSRAEGVHKIVGRMLRLN